MLAVSTSFAIGLLFQMAGASPAQRAGSPPDSVEKGVVAGYVVDAITGEPIKKAKVTLNRSGTTGNMAVESRTSVVTDAAGHFEFLNVYPGDCAVIASRPGYAGEGRPSVATTGSRVQLTLEPGEKTTNVRLRLLPQGVITGRVVDENGEPARGVSVSALKPSYSSGALSLTSAGVSAGSTNDLGVYRIYGLTPGRYYLQARAFASSPGLTGLAVGADRMYPEIYYPSATDIEAATRVEVRAGAETGNITFALRPARGVSVTGRVVDGATGSPAARASVSLLLSGNQLGMSRTATTNARGEFELTALLPGSYVVSASGAAGQTSLTARETISVGSSGLEGVLLRLAPEATITGRVRLEGLNDSPNIDFSKVRILLLLRNMGFQAILSIGSTSSQVSALAGADPSGLPSRGPGGIDAQGNFTWNRLPFARIEAGISGLPPRFYLKSALLDDQETVNTGFEAAPGSSHRLDLVVSGDSAQVEGVVLDSKDNPAAQAKVALIPADPALRVAVRLYRSAETTQNGRFTLRTIPPGKYRICAWDGVEDGAWFDPDFMARFEQAGEAVSLDPKDRKTVSLKLLSDSAR